MGRCHFSIYAVMFIAMLGAVSIANADSASPVSRVGPVVPATEGTIQPETIIDTPPFEPGTWSKGIHLLAGFGANSSVFNTARTYRDYGFGSNFKTDIGYYLNSNFAIEFGSDVKFNWVDQLLVWDTLFTAGVRVRLKSLFFSDEASFVRAYVGSAPTVVFLNGTQPKLQKAGATRIQYNGPVVGAGLGRFYKTAGGLIWFTEAAVAYQWLQTQEVIKDVNDVPIAVSDSTVNDESKIFSAFFNVGMMIF